MSVSTYQSQIHRLQRDIADLQDRISRETKKEADAVGKAARVQQALSGRVSSSQLQSKLRELARHQDDIARAQKEQSALTKRMADKVRDLHRAQTSLLREEERERRRLEESEQARRRELEAYNRRLGKQLTAQQASLDRTGGLNEAANEGSPMKEFDLFISHASEDKDAFVRPLATALQELGVVVWYDELQLRVGDSLRRSIDKGLANSRFGVVVLSSAFFAKNWPQYELDGMVAREVAGVKVILPIWHRVTKDEVLRFSPTLADKVALNSSLKSIGEIAADLAAVALDGKGSRA